MRRLCIVPARGGSKRFPNKNIAILDGKPLVQHTLEVVQPHFTKVIFSSDSNEILGIVQEIVKKKRWDNVFCSKQPANLSGDTNKVIEVVSHYFVQHRNHFDQIWLALPTCPMRNEEDVKGCFELLDQGADSVITFTDYEFPPTLALKLDRQNGELFDFDQLNKPWWNGNSRSQDHERLYRPNGALYGMWVEKFERPRNFYRTEYLTGYWMPRDRSVDLDTELDFKFASFLINERKPKDEPKPNNDNTKVESGDSQPSGGDLQEGRTQPDGSSS